jgi:hypothetical protein
LNGMNEPRAGARGGDDPSSAVFILSSQSANGRRNSPERLGG